jgi:hypothetical protein
MTGLPVFSDQVIVADALSDADSLLITPSRSRSGWADSRLCAGSLPDLR